jgi:hypothetical protein
MKIGKGCGRAINLKSEYNRGNINAFQLIDWGGKLLHLQSHESHFINDNETEED